MHKSLKVRSNVIILVVFFVIAVIGYSSVQPFSVLFVIISCLFGTLLGITQSMSMRENPQIFLETKSAIDVRRAITSTKVGKFYVVFLWGSLFFIYAISQKMGIGDGFVAGAATIMFTRDMITLPALIELNKMGK